MPVHRKAEFALTESIGWFGCDGERDLAQLAVNSASAFSAYSYCKQLFMHLFSDRADLNNSPSVISF